MSSPAARPADASRAPGPDASAASGDLRYPLGKLVLPTRFDAEWRGSAIADVAAVPAALAQAVRGWDDDRLDTPYRPGGWTVRQLVHHVADSHMNAYVRFKLTLTEENPPVKAYDEAAWAELPDSATVPVAVSLTLLEAVHTRWVALLQAMTEAQFQRTLVHPANGVRTLDQMLATYAWHGRHHVAHATRLAERMGWR